MSQEIYRYTFTDDNLLEDVEASLVLALLAAETLHGEAQVKLDAAHHLDLEQRACAIDAGSPVGRDLNRLFAGFLRREFGPGAFQVERLQEPAASAVA